MPAMETSFANGGQLSVSNAEVWNSPATLLKGLKWMFDAAAPLLAEPPAELAQVFVAGRIRRADSALPEEHARHRASRARGAASNCSQIAEKRRHRLRSRTARHPARLSRSAPVSSMPPASTTCCSEGGLDRRAVTPGEIRSIEPTLRRRLLRRLLHAVGFDRRHPQVHPRPRGGVRAARRELRLRRQCRHRRP